MGDLVTIGHFSELTGLTIKALRLYDRLGLLHPTVVDFSSGYRYYSSDQVSIAKRIRLLRDLDMPLEEIRALLAEHRPGAVQQQLARHRRWIENRIASYQDAWTLLQTLDDWATSVDREESVGGATGEHQCSFCGKRNREVRRMIAGRGGAIICNECVGQCNRIVAEEEGVSRDEETRQVKGRVVIPVRISQLLINRNFALLWMGRSISNFGDSIFDTTLVLWIATRLAYGQTWAPLAVSGIFLAISFPTFIIGPVAGVFADRWDKRLTMLTTDALRALLIVVLALTTVLPIPVLAGGYLPVRAQLAGIYAVVLLATICALFFSPSRLALIRDLVDEPDRARASSLLQVTDSVARLAGPAVAAPLFYLFGVQWALIANALSFVVSFLALLAIQAPPPARSVALGEVGSVLRELADGFRFFLGNRVLVTIVISVMLAMLGFGALNALNVFFLTQNLHARVTLYGLLSSALGFGAVVGAALAGVLAHRLGVARLFWLSMMGMGTLVVIYSRLTMFLPAVAVLFLLGIVNDATEVAIGPMMLQATPRELIGRVSAVMLPAAYLASMFSTSLAAFLDSTVLRGLHLNLLGISWGQTDTIFTGAGLLTLGGGIYAAIALGGVELGQEKALGDERERGQGGAA